MKCSGRKWVNGTEKEYLNVIQHLKFRKMNIQTLTDIVAELPQSLKITKDVKIL